jgi:cytochrome b6-f complex iron-sulfur subunit
LTRAPKDGTVRTARAATGATTVSRWLNSGHDGLMAEPTRRTFLAQALAGAGLAVSYGLLATYAIAYLFPPRARRRAQRLFIGRRAEFPPGSTRRYVDQRGRTLLILGRDAGIDAFDTRCPHLGCHVHWETERERFVCPCHQGIFDRDGVAIAGPPAAAGQALTRAALEIDAVSGTVFLKDEG